MPRKKKELSIEKIDVGNPTVEQPEQVVADTWLPPIVVPKVQLASILGVSYTTLQSYESKDLIVKIGSKIDVIPTMVKLVNHFRAMSANKLASGDLKEEKTHEEIRQLRLQNAKVEGELVDIESVHAVIRKALVGTADWLESLPDALESQGVIAPEAAGRFIKILDNQRHALLNMVLTGIEEDVDLPD